MYTVVLKTLLFLIFCLKIRTVHSQEPQIVDEILTEVKRIGETGYLNCTVVRKGTNTVIWMHEAIKQVLSMDEDIKLAYNPIIGGQKKFEVVMRKNGGRQTFMLIIRGLREDDAGRYLCYIYIPAVQNDYPERYGLLTVQVPPKILVSQTSNTVQISSGNDVQLKCNASGIPHPNITWIRANGRALPSGTYSYKGNNMLIRKIHWVDRGIYRCVADNTVPPSDKHDTTVEVLSKPKVTAVQDTVGQAQNGKYSAILECRITAIPDAVLRWFKQTNRGKMVLTDNDKFSIQKMLSSELQPGQTWYYLKVKNIQANDYGNYYCEGKNKFGVQRTTITLFETFECQGSNCPSLGGGCAMISALYSILIVSILSVYLLAK